jgi:hypothetical protein
MQRSDLAGLLLQLKVGLEAAVGVLFVLSEGCYGAVFMTCRQKAAAAA